MHPKLRRGISWLHSPQQVCHSGQHPAGPGCGRNGTCWQFQIAGGRHTETELSGKKLQSVQSVFKDGQGLLLKVDHKIISRESLGRVKGELVRCIIRRFHQVSDEDENFSTFTDISVISVSTS